MNKKTILKKNLYINMFIIWCFLILNIIFLIFSLLVIFVISVIEFLNLTKNKS